MTVDGREACTDSDKLACGAAARNGEHRCEYSVPLYAAPPADAKDAARLDYIEKHMVILADPCAFGIRLATGRNLHVLSLRQAIDAAMLETSTKEAT